MISQPTVWAFGGGTNSTAGIIKSVQLGERIDAILFADTGGERPGTYSHIKTFSDWLLARGYPSVTVIRRNGLSLEERCLSQKVLPAIAYGSKACSVRFKIQPQWRWVRNWQIALEAWERGDKVVMCVGYDADEPSRLTGARRVEERGRKSQELIEAGVPRSDPRVDAQLALEWRCIRKRYPLIEEWDMGREECAEVCLDAIGYTPSKSSCFFCPNMREHEVIALDEQHPDLLERALKLERNAETSTGLGLWRNKKWGDFIEHWRRQGQLFDLASLRREEDMPCGCYDG